MTKNLFWFLSISIVLTCLFSSRDFDSRYGRSINGDGKAYYAYLPALFIYNDPSYAFVDSMEMKYYPEDRSQFKDFKNEQKNGKYVNKTFPGLSILYAPFFFLAMFVSWIGGYAIDGYSTPFQIGIALSHIVYFFIGLRFLLSFFRSLKIKDSISYTLFTGILFGTNVWYYLVYDHSVGHIHNFFMACVFIWTLSRWIQTKRVYFLGWSGVILSLLIITRPTNAVMLLFLPFLASLYSVNLKELFSKKYLQFKPLVPYVGLGMTLLAIPFLLWKWQSDLWIVYSYGEEGFDFTDPQLFNFLFSYEKGWLLWAPLMLVFLILGTIYLLKQSILHLVYFWIPLGLIIYVLSSWWCWTYGAGFGQRPMIEYYPFILIGAALLLKNRKRFAMILLLTVPFCLLSFVQSYQIANSILNGGTTTKEQYWSHFLQLKRDAPRVEIDPKWKLIDSKKLSFHQKVDKEHAFSKSVKTSELDSVQKIVIRSEIGGKHKDPNLSLVVSNQDGSFYQSLNLGYVLYSEPRLIEFAVDVPRLKDQQFVFYVWNGDTESEAVIDFMEIRCYK